jgi:WD40 repeat protein
MLIDGLVTVVGDRLITVNKSKDIQVRLLHTGQEVHTIRTGCNMICCFTPVPGHSELIVTGHDNGDVRLWDIDKGARAWECMNVNAGVHVRQIVQLEKCVHAIVASSTRLMCSYDYTQKAAIVHFGDKKIH